MGNTALAAKMVEVAKSLGWIEKGGRNTAQNYDFVRAVDVFAQVRKELQERNVAFALDITDVEHIPFTTKSGTPTFLTTVKANASFIDADTGEVITGGAAGTGADSGDKSTAKAITALLKYALIGAFLLPTGDDPEADERIDPEQTAEAPRKAVVTRNPSSSAPVPPKAERAVAARSDEVGLSEKQRAMFMARLKEKGFETAAQRKAFLALVVGKHSTTQMTSADLDKALAELEDPTITPQTTVAA